MRPWLGDSLLTSEGTDWSEAGSWNHHQTLILTSLNNLGPKWKTRRACLFTPSFNFEILKTFVGTFNDQSLVLCRKLQDLCRRETPEIDIFPLMAACSLDIICGKQDTDYLLQSTPCMCNEFIDWRVQLIRDSHGMQNERSSWPLRIQRSCSQVCSLVIFDMFHSKIKGEF